MTISKWQWMLRYLRKQWSLRKTLRGWCQLIVAWRRFWLSYQQYTHLAAEDQKPLLKNLYPCIGDDTILTTIEPTYFYQDAWAFEHIVRNRPKFHVDVGSHHKFVALLSKVVPVTMVDIRPLSLPLESLTFRHGTILALPFADGEVPSVSSLCVVEHIGLGRYGDPLDPLGTEKAIEELKRIVAPFGFLYLSVPVGDTKIIAFNAGRVLSLDGLLQIVQPFKLMEQRFIVGSSFQATYEASYPFGTTILLKLQKQI